MNISHLQRRMRANRRARRITRRANRKGVSVLEYLSGVILAQAKRNGELKIRTAVDVAAEWGW